MKVFRQEIHNHSEPNLKRKSTSFILLDMSSPSSKFNSIVKRVLALQQEALVQVLSNQSTFQEDEGVEIDHRLYPREKKTKYDHERALYCIRSDYLGRIPRFNDRQFESMFRLSRSRFQRLMFDVGNEDIKFYTDNMDGTGVIGSSFEARLLLPLKCMAYGVPPHTFRDYFQMSETLAKTCCYRFYETIVDIYLGEYLRMPTAEDLRNVTHLHETVHGVPGMFGSLDCMHTWWKNCPVAWKGSYKGKEKRSTIVLEAACDYHLWFWHAAYGYAGTLNDINILNMSPLMDRILDGTFQELEKDLVPFKIGDEEFKRLYMLVDGIYPKWTRFVKAILQPVGSDETKFTSWQESARKDIDRAFGVLQCKFQCVARPIYLMELVHIRNMVTASLILHNMCVSDRVMGDVYSRYNPAFNVQLEKMERSNVRQPHDLKGKQGPNYTRFSSVETHWNGDTDVFKLVAGDSRYSEPEDLDALRRWDELHNPRDYHRLQAALMKYKST